MSISGRGGGKLSGDSSGLQGIGLFASWELDLWGRVRATRAFGTAQYESAALDARYARESIAATLAKSWFLARQAAAQRAIAAEMLEASLALAELSRDRLRVGKGDEYEVSQAEANVLSYRDLVLQAELTYPGSVLPGDAYQQGVDLAELHDGYYHVLLTLDGYESDAETYKLHVRVESGMFELKTWHRDM